MGVDSQIIRTIEEGKFDEALSLASVNNFSFEVLIFIANTCNFKLLGEFYPFDLEKGFRRVLTLVNVAISRGRVDVIDFLYGVMELNPNFHIGVLRETALALACRHNKRDIVERLLNWDADPEQTDCFGRNAFFYATNSSDINIFRLLLLRTGRIDYIDKQGKNLFHYMCSQPILYHEIFVEILGLDVLDVNAQDRLGYTPLHLLVPWSVSFSSRKDTVLILLEHPNIDLTIKNQEGKTAWDLYRGRYEIPRSVHQAFHKALKL